MVTEVRSTSQIKPQQISKKSLEITLFSQSNHSSYALYRLITSFRQSEIELLAYLQRFYWKERFQVSVKRILRETGMKRRTVERAISYLRENNIIIGRQSKMYEVVVYKFVRSTFTPVMRDVFRTFTSSSGSYNGKNGGHIYNTSLRNTKNNLYTKPARDSHSDRDRATHKVKALPRQIFKRLLGTGKGLSVTAFRHKIRTVCRDQFPRLIRYLWNSPDVCESQLLFLLLHVDTLRLLDMPEWVTPHPSSAAPSPHGEIVTRLIGYIKKVIGSSSNAGKANYSLMKRCKSVAGFEDKKREVVRAGYAKVEKIKKPPKAPVYSPAKEEHTRDFYKQLLSSLTPKGYANA